MAGSGPLVQGSKLQNGKYVIEEVLGEGGFGITYRATDTLLGRIVAIKELYPEGSVRTGEHVTVPLTYTQGRWSKAIGDFLREARTLASLDHPDIVAVHDYFEENNTAYMVMRFIDGVDLVKVMVQRGGRLPEDEAIRYISEVGAALSVLHGRGVLHRDIKPSNILVNRQGHAVLVDFGAAREFISNQAITHTVVASFGFAPPEQFHARALRGPFTDVYSLAATCYYLLTGSLPTREAVEDQQIRPQLRAALEHAMAYNPEQRPPDVATFLAELQGRTPSPILDSHPVAGNLPAATRDMSVPADYPGPQVVGGASTDSNFVRPAGSQPPSAPSDYQPNVAANNQPPSTPPPQSNWQAAPPQFAPPPTQPPFAVPPLMPPPPAVADKPQRGAPWSLIGEGLLVLASLALILIVLMSGNKGSAIPPIVAQTSSPTPLIKATTLPVGAATSAPTDTTAATDTLTPTTAAALDTPGTVITTGVAITPTDTAGEVITPTDTAAPVITPTVAAEFDFANVYLNSVSMSAADEGWAVGEVKTGTGDNAPISGAMLHYHNGRWRRDTTAPDIPALYSVFMLSADDGWAVGGAYTPTDKGIILHYSAGKWLPVHDVNVTTLDDIYMVSADEGWAVGGGIIAHYQNGHWALADNPVSSVGLTSVYMISASDGWAVGSSGTILHYNGSQWQLVNIGTSDTLYGVYMINSSEGWAVGRAAQKNVNDPISGVILHYQNGNWAAVQANVQDALLAVQMVSPTEGWAVGGYGAGLWNYTNSGWAAVDATRSLAGLQMLAANDGWAVGGNDTGALILHYDGTQWSEVLSTATPAGP